MNESKATICGDECNFVEGAKIVPVTSTEQLVRWINDDPVHSSITNECCPDFSCCTPGGLSSLPFRKAFMKAHLCGDRETVEKMLMGCLAGTIPAKVYVTGGRVKEEPS